MGGSCSMLWRRRKQVQGSIGQPDGNRPVRRPVCVDGRIILKCALNSTGWFGLSFVGQERDEWYVVLYMEIKFCEHGDELTSSVRFGKFREYRVTVDVSGGTVLSVGL